MSGYVPTGWAPTLKPEERDMPRLYREREEKRRAATRQDIESAGIPVDDDEIEEVGDDHFDCPPLKKVKLGPRNHARKWKTYTYEEFVEENGERFAEEVEIEKEYQVRFNDHYLKVVTELGAINFGRELLVKYFFEANANVRKIDMAAAKWDKMVADGEKKNNKAPVSQGKKLDFISSLSTIPELVIALGKHLTPREILTLYSISRDFKYTVDHNMQACIIQWGRHMIGLPGMRLCMMKPYENYFILDPLMRTKPQLSMAHITHPERPPPQLKGDERVRPVPSLKWLQMTAHREICIRDIIAVLARNGHRLPPGAFQSLRKLWMIMDISSSPGRTSMIKNQFIQPRDLIHMQMFFVKLQLLFNDPVYGPKSSMLLKLMLGQRSLTTLWAMLRRKKYTTQNEIVQLKLRYDVSPTYTQIMRGKPVNGISIIEMGLLHFEGWGIGNDHLIRPDQLVALECARRQLGLSHGLRDMMRYGHCDPITGAPAVPSLDEMYMSDSELPPSNFFLLPEGDPNTPIHSGCGNVVFEPHHWQPKHARKARWETLATTEKEMLLDEEWRCVSRDFAMDGELAVLDQAKNQIAVAVHSLGMWNPGRAKLNLDTRLPELATALRDDVDMTNAPPIPSTPVCPTVGPGLDPTKPPVGTSRRPETPAYRRRIRALVKDTALLDITDDEPESPHVDDIVNDERYFDWYGPSSSSSGDETAAPDESLTEDASRKSPAEDEEEYDDEEYDEDEECYDDDEEEEEDEPSPLSPHHGQPATPSWYPPDDGESHFLASVNPHHLFMYKVPVEDHMYSNGTVETLDEHLLKLGDVTGVQDDEYNPATGEWFDWEGYVEDFVADQVGEVGKKGKVVEDRMVVDEDGEDADDEVNEEDERVKMLRGYYRLW